MASIGSPLALLQVVNHVEPAQNYDVALLPLEYKNHSENNLEDNKLNCKVFFIFLCAVAMRSVNDTYYNNT